MMSKSFLTFSASALALIATSAGHAQALPAAASGGGVETGQDIVVTASRRSERLRDVPSAITALDGEKLAQLGVRDTNDYLALVPGVSFRDSGTPGQGTVIIRGLFSGAQQLTNTTATYIDDAPFSASGFLSAGALLNPDPDVADLDRLEVLKGPQGTLYGANSLGGLVRIVTKRPDLAHVSGFVQAEGSATDHGDNGYAFHGSVNVPIVSDQLALRLNGVYRRIGGVIDNVATGAKDFDSSTIKGGRAALRWRPAPNLTVDLSGVLQNIHNNGYSQQLNATGTLTPLYGKYTTYVRPSVPSDLKYRLASATVDYDLGPISLIAVGSYGKYNTRNLSDYTDSYYAYARIASPAYAAVLPANGMAVGNFSPNMKKWTAEVRAVSKRLGRFEFVAGGFYTDEKNVYNTTITAQNANGVPLAGNFSTGIPLANLVTTRTLSNYKEVAGFLNGTFYIADNLDVGAGVRYAHNTQQAATGALDGADTFYAPRARRDFAFSDSVATYLATIRFRPNSHISMYLRAASGYRPGGPQTNPSPPPGAQTSIRPDSTWNYEGGVKASFGAFSIDGSVFHIDWKDIQLNTLSGGVVLGANGGQAKVDGFELSASARPGRFTTFSATVGYTNSRLSQVDTGVQAYLGVVKGDKLPLTPDWTATVMADQAIPLSEGVKGNLGATLRFRADMPSSFPGSTTDRNIQIPSVTTVDLRAGVNFGRYTLQLRAENLFNTLGYNSLSTPQLYAGQPVPTVGSLIRPRTLVLSASARF